MPPELRMPSLSRPTVDKPDVPKLTKPSKPSTRLGPDRISIHSFSVDPDKVFTQLFQQEPKINEMTGAVENFLPQYRNKPFGG
jgi:hypothetical protein